MTESGILHCIELDGDGGGRFMETLAELEASPDEGISWIHLDVGNERAGQWIDQLHDVDPIVKEGLQADETRPRSLNLNSGGYLVLRGVNTNPGEDPEDMVSIRIWVERERIITTCRRRLLAVQDIRSTIKEGRGPRTSGEFVAVLVAHIADRIGVFVDRIEDQLSEAEESLGADDPSIQRGKLSRLRRQIASVRRFLAPQRDALDRLYRNPAAWLSEQESSTLREETDRMTRYLEDLDLAKERSIVLQEEYLSLITQEQNNRIYVLSVVAAIFLPLSFLTGLLGMNVGGLPGVENPQGFWISSAIMLVVALALGAYMRWKRWI